MKDRPHIFEVREGVMYCKNCGMIGYWFSKGSGSQENHEAQRIAKQPCPRGDKSE